MTSRFFAGAASSSESDNESDVRSEKSEEEEVVKRQFIYESSSDEEEKRVVRSEKDKRYDALRTIITRIKDKMRIQDFVSLGDQFDDLNKNLEKSKKVIEKEGVPQFYIRICYVLENFLNDLTKEEKNSLKKDNQKAYNTLKHKVKKNNKLYEDKIKAFAENPVSSAEEADSDEDGAHKKAKKGKAQKAKDSEDEGWGSSGSDGEESDEEEEGLSKYLQSNDPMVRRNYWLKRDEPEKEKEKEKKVREIKVKAKKEYDDEVKPAKVIYTLDELDKRIVEIVERRAGRKASKEKKVSVEDDLEALQSLYDKVEGDEIKRLEVLLIQIPTRTDYSRQFSQYCMPRALWQENFENLEEFFKIIKNKKNNLTQVRTFQKDGDLFYKESAVIESFSTHFDGLDNELYKALKAFESVTAEYAERMRDYAQLVKLADHAFSHFRNANDNDHTSKFAQKKLELVYYLSDSLYGKLRASATERGINTKDEFYEEQSSEKTVHELATRVYTASSPDNKLIIRTLLYQIYNHAINGRYHVAKEYFLMSHLAELGPNLDAGTQIIYNRTLVQLGLSAFSIGLIQESMNALNDIANSGRLRELLGQGVSKNTYNEKEERRRMLPIHMHINTDLVEAVQLMSAMLIEVPTLETADVQKKQALRSFKKQFEVYRNFYGPPETNKDRIMVAARELQSGHWKKCYENLLQMNIWSKLTQDAKKTQENLLTRVKEQGFKCHLHNIRNVYDAINIQSLARQFDLETNTVHSMISKLVFNREIKAYLDVESDCLIFEKTDVNKLENRALVLADRVSTLLVNNEKIMDSKYGNYGISEKDILTNKRNITKRNKLNTVFNKDKKKPKTKRT